MYEVRVYRRIGKMKIRAAKINNTDEFGFWRWCRLWFALKK